MTKHLHLIQRQLTFAGPSYHRNERNTPAHLMFEGRTNGDLCHLVSPKESWSRWISHKLSNPKIVGAVTGLMMGPLLGSPIVTVHAAEGMARVAEKDDRNGSHVPPATDVFSNLSSALDKAFSPFDSMSPLATKIASVLFLGGKTPRAAKERFGEMLGDLSNMLCVRAPAGRWDAKHLGFAAKGYVPVNEYLTESDIVAIARVYDRAIADFQRAKDAGRDMQWSTWRSYFRSDEHSDGDAKRALGAVMLHLGLLHAAMNDTLRSSIEAKSLLKKISTNGQTSFYSVGPFEPRAFGFDLPGANTSAGWGKAYKAIAGANLTLALREKSYSREEIRMAVKLANVFYEAFDMLADHCAKPELWGATACPDNANRELGKCFDVWIKDVRALLSSNPQVKNRLVAAALDTSRVFARFFSPIAARIDWNDDVVLNAFLLTYRVNDPGGFARDIEPTFTGARMGKELKNEYEDSARDVAHAMRGCEWVLKLAPTK